MQIHELPSGTLSNSDVTAIDNGTSTRKYSIGTAINTLNGNINRNDLLSLTKNSSYIGDFTNASYRLSGHIAMLNGFFRFSTTSVPQASTLFTLPSGNTFKCRQYIQIANNDFSSNVTLEVRENTDIIRAGTAFENLSTNKYYYFCFITDFV